MFPGSASPSSESVFALRDFFPRGGQSSVLVSHLQNTIPYVFDGDFGGIRIDERRPFLPEIVAAAADPDREWLRADYFRLCLSAHWASVASFVPIDVDSQIRFKLWDPALPTDVIREMAETVLGAYAWDSTAISRRWISSPYSKLVLSCHHGEWFSVAVAAYAATRNRDSILSMRIREAIEYEVTREAKIYLEFRKARDGVGMLLASTLIAHNLGDLDRLIDVWGLGVDDPLYEFAYRAGHAVGSRAARFGGALAEAGRMNRAFMGAENHRHFALRGPRALRRSVDLLLPMAPFLDEWGARVATHPGLTPQDVAAVVDALYSGWEKLKGPDGLKITHAYPRAVAGILDAYPGGMSALSEILPARVERNLRTGLFRSLVTVPEPRFAEQWAQRALGLLR